MKPIEKEMVGMVKEYKPQWGEDEIREFCKQHNWSKDDINKGISEAYESTSCPMNSPVVHVHFLSPGPSQNLGFSVSMFCFSFAP